MPYQKYRTLIEIFFFWLLPLTVLPWSLSQLIPIYSFDLALFLVFFPAITMYWVVGTGAGYCKFWYFTTNYSPAGVMLTIGLLYATVVHSSIPWTLPYMENNPLLFVGLTGLTVSVGGTFIDIFLLGSGLFYLKSKKFPRGSNPIRHALSYGPLFFGIVGVWNALGILLGKWLMESIDQNLVVTLTILPFLFALPFMVFFLFRLRKINLMKIASTTSSS
ncbi:hypothetical protein [Algoriphagus confluentis]|uniref:Uncharacterized protein n=1 Tax=Algoriphagus confluentis TaxID=1697556 RepID=A0ABQ6PRY4_9BACT|nr:hypothetical protein Aconfl_31410 [Algoriphagus confluentis]